MSEDMDFLELRTESSAERRAHILAGNDSDSKLSMIRRCAQAVEALIRHVVEQVCMLGWRQRANEVQPGFGEVGEVAGRVLSGVEDHRGCCGTCPVDKALVTRDEFRRRRGTG